MGRTGIGLVCLWLWAVLVVADGENVNVALGKTYDQSSTWSFDHPASMAANGDTSPRYPDNCINTAYNGDLNPWWEVDLGRTYPVKDIHIWHRFNYRHQLFPSQITVDGRLCATIRTYPTNSFRRKVTCSAVMYGQTVRITRLSTTQESNEDRILSLCELQIWVPSEISQCPVGKYGVYCNHNCNNNCGKGPGKNACYQSSGYCYDECVAGWYGDQCSSGCSTGCQNITCYRPTGECFPCKTGYTGIQCTADGKTADTDKSDCEDINTPAIIGSVVGTAVFIAICIIIIWAIKSRKTSCRNTNAMDERGQHNSY